MALSFTVHLLRNVLFGVVMFWTLIVFALLIHFQQLVIPSELTSFIPFGIIVSILTFLILGTLIVLGRARKAFMVAQVRSELLFVGLLGFMWFALGLYTSTGTLADIEVECTDDAGEDEWDPSEALLAQYRTVKAFAFFNGILLLALCFFLLALCIRHHIAGRRQVWTARVPTFPWFVFGTVKQAQPQEKREANLSPLPPPVTASPRRASTRPGHVSRPSQQPLLATDLSQLAPGESRMVWIPPPDSAVGGANRYGSSRYGATVGRSGSKQSNSSSTRPLRAPQASGLSRDPSRSTTASSRAGQPVTAAKRTDSSMPRRTDSGATRSANGGLSRSGTGGSSRPAGVPTRSATTDTQRKR
ncbi:hypothetical protein BDV93DRAFT_519635 [Ceratobasidium sp. AG-I]|nr:hypothetical protein BDV93DRAFT_519635 [Ceratobasidium sp. AG-I]